MTKAHVFIGMPVYNGEAYIRDAIDSIVHQEFSGWTLLVADNCSEDRTREIVAEYVIRDSRIRYQRHTRNLGAGGNFRYLLDQADAPFFMWAAADDELSINAISSCLSHLEKDGAIEFSSPAVVNTDPGGNVIRRYRGFEMFEDDSAVVRLKRYVAAVEIDGKANPIYALYRTDFCRMLFTIPRIFDGWGADMAFVSAGLARGGYRFVPEAEIRKRVVKPDDIATTLLMASGQRNAIPYGGEFPLTKAPQYVAALVRAAPTWFMRLVVISVMGARVLSLVLSLASGRVKWRS